MHQAMALKKFEATEEFKNLQKNWWEECIINFELSLPLKFRSGQLDEILDRERKSVSKNPVIQVMRNPGRRRLNSTEIP